LVDFFKKQRKDTKSKGNLKVLNHKFGDPRAEKNESVSTVDPVVSVWINWAGESLCDNSF